MLVAPQYVGNVMSSNGTAQAHFNLPNATSLAGTVFYSQMVPLEVDPMLNIVAATSTNALAMTVGSF